MKKFLLSIICLLTVCSLCACTGKEAKTAPLLFGEDFKSDIPKQDITAAENSRYRLMWDAKNKRVVFYDKEKNIPWSYTPVSAQTEKFDEDGIALNNHPQLESPVTVTYYDAEKSVTDTSIATTASIKKKNYSVKKTDSGLRTVLSFEKEKIEITVDFILRGDSLAVSIDPKNIREDGYKVISVAIAPFFCSVQNETENSYLFFPSGSGALIYADYSSDDVNIISEEVYGTDARRPEDDVIKTLSSSVRLPVYGAKEGDRAITAIIEENAGAATVNANVGNAVIGYSSVYASFNVRSSEMVLTNNLSGRRTKYSDEMTSEPLTVGFYPLYGDDADYVGMANCYRNYLKKDNLMKSDKQDGGITLKILGAAEYKKSFLGMSYNSLKAATTVPQAQQIISEIGEKTGMQVNAQLYGFGPSGTDIGKLAGNFKLAGALGKKEDIKALSDYCNEKNYSLFTDFDLLQFSKSSLFAGINNSSAIEATGRRITLYKYLKWSGTRDMSSRGLNNKSSFTLLKRSKIRRTVEKLGEAADKLGLGGVSVTTLSNIAYSDHSKQEYYSKGLMGEQLSGEFKNLRKSRDVMVSDANAYAAANASYITDAPTASSKYDLFDEDIPFYEIVFKGVIPMASTPVNLGGDSNINLLKCVEAGISMSFAVSYNTDNDLSGGENILFYPSGYEGVRESVISLAKENKKIFDAVKDAKIASHEIVSKNVRKTEFANGVTVYVNYGNIAADTALGRIEPYSYIFEEGGRQ